MPTEVFEIECPVCDAKISPDTHRCPRCGADLDMAEFKDLEDVADTLAKGAAQGEDAKTPQDNNGSKVPVTGDADKNGPPADASSSKDTKEDDEHRTEENNTEKKEEKKHGLFSKLFGRK